MPFAVAYGTIPADSYRVRRPDLNDARAPTRLDECVVLHGGQAEREVRCAPRDRTRSAGADLKPAVRSVVSANERRAVSAFAVVVCSAGSAPAFSDRGVRMVARARNIRRWKRHRKAAAPQPGREAPAYRSSALTPPLGTLIVLSIVLRSWVRPLSGENPETVRKWSFVASLSSAGRQNAAGQTWRCKMPRESLGNLLGLFDKFRLAPHYHSPRGRGMSISSTFSIRPGRGVASDDAVCQSTASSMRWVMNTTVMRFFSQSASKSIRICSRVSASSAPKAHPSAKPGLKRQRARNGARCFIPPDSSCGYRLAKSLRPADSKRQRVGSQFLTVPAGHFSREKHVVDNRSPGQKHVILEDDAHAAQRIADTSPKTDIWPVLA